MITQDKKSTTTYRKLYKTPCKQPRPTSRNFFETEPNFKAQECIRPKTQSSGYSCNAMTMDNTGWVPEKCFHSDMNRTEYRIRYNNPQSTHYEGIKINDGKLKKRETSYSFT